MRALLAGIALSAIAFAAACGSGSAAEPGSAPAAGGPAPAKHSHWRHVVWIVMENKSFGRALDPASAPYTAGLAKRYGIATDYHAVAHPSLPNYIAMTSGSTRGIGDDGPPSEHRLDGPSIFSQVRDWRALQESMPASCSAQTTPAYAVKHNPAAYFVSVRAACARRDVALASAPDISHRLTFITPNMCDDTHDCGVRAGDAWLRRLVPRLLSTAAYRSGRTAIFITWDEDDGSAHNRVPLIVISPRTRHRRAGARFTHYSLLRTTEEMLRVRLLGAAASAPSMRAAFGL